MAGPVPSVAFRRPDRLLSRLAVLYVTVALSFRLGRFWGRTALRRLIWSSISIGGEPLEYHGRADELLGGAVLGLAVLLPIPTASSALYMIIDPAPAGFALISNGYLVAFIFLFAAGDYSARRYQLSRTQWRGIRAGQDGSAWLYAGRYLMWAIAFVLTAGLSVPWAAADLARYAMRHTLWGDYRGSFRGTARQLLHPWLVTWAICIGPLFAGLLWQLSWYGWRSDILWRLPADLLDTLISSDDISAVWVAAGLICYSALVWLVYRLRWMEWYISNATIGPLRASCTVDLRGFLHRVDRGILGCVAIVIGFVIGLDYLSRDDVPLFGELNYEAFVWVALACVLVTWSLLGFVFHAFVYFPLLQTLGEATVVWNLPAAAGVQQRPDRPRGFAEVLADGTGCQMV